MIRTYLNSLSILFFLMTIIPFGCKENPTEAEKINESFVEIVSPLEGSSFGKLDNIKFKAFLLSGTDTLQYDSLKWESDISGLIAKYNIYTMLSTGNHKITCTVYQNNKSFSSKVSLTVNTTFAVDTIYYDNKLEVFKIAGADIYALTLDNNDNPLIGTVNLGLFYRDNGIWLNYNKTDGLYDVAIQCMETDKNNVIYIGYGYYSGISKRQNNGWEFIPMDESFGGDVHVIRFDENNILWTANHNGDITRFKNGNWYHFAGLPINYHHPDELLFDKEMVLWSVSTYGSLSFDGQTWKSLKVNGEIVSASSLAIDKDDNKWIGCFHSHEVIKISNKDTVIFNPQNSLLPESAIWAIAIDQNNITYIGTDYGIFKYNGQSWNEISLPQLGDQRITKIKLDSKNNIWFTTQTYFGSIKQ